MQYISTRSAEQNFSLVEALRLGLAPDGGLFVPECLPKLSDPQTLFCDSYADFAEKLLAPFFQGSPLAAELATICQQTFTFDIPLRFLDDEGTAILELFWGPTAAFKDVGARFLAHCLPLCQQALKGEQALTLLVATSGDTGGAVAAAFHRQARIRVAVLFPSDGVAPRQRQQLTAWGDNICAFAVKGTFDDCQKLAKAAFADKALSQKHQLTSANSINIGRLLPQMVYFAYSSLLFEQKEQRAARFIVPSGNVGNATAALWAKRMGFPISHIVMANNQNGIMTDAFKAQKFSSRASIATLANAMDVGNPSNVERLLHGVNHDIALLQREMSAFTVSDAEIKARIQKTQQKFGLILCPHTATAFEVLEREGLAGSICVATAHPAKFPEIVEPLLGIEVPIPPSLQSILDKATQVLPLEPTLAALDLGLS